MNKKQILVFIILLIVICISVIFYFRKEIFYDVEGNIDNTYTTCFSNNLRGVLQKDKTCKTDEGTVCTINWVSRREFSLGVLKENTCVPKSAGSPCSIDKNKKGVIPSEKEFKRYDELCIEK